MQNSAVLEDSLLRFRATSDPTLIAPHIAQLSETIADVEDPEPIALYARMLFARLMADRELGLDDRYAEEIARLRAAAFRLRMLVPLAAESLLVEALLCIVRLKLCVDENEMTKYFVRGRRYLEDALTTDPTNPEIMFLFAMFELNTPADYGGDHARGRSLVEKLAQYPRYEPLVRHLAPPGTAETAC